MRIEHWVKNRGPSSSSIHQNNDDCGTMTHPRPHRACSSAAQHEKWKFLHYLHSAAAAALCMNTLTTVVSIVCAMSPRHVAPYALCVDGA